MTTYVDNKEDLIKEIEERFQIWDVSTIGVYEKSADGKIVFVCNVHKNEPIELPKLNKNCEFIIGKEF